MADHFDPVFDRTLGKEGGFVDNPLDRGGPTRWGITEAVARRHGYAGSMRDLPVELARAIGKAEFWDVLRLDEVAALSPAIADELYDTGLNGGPSVAARFLQRALNGLNRSHRNPPDYPEVIVDSVLGARSVEALAAFLRIRAARGEAVMLRALNGQQLVRYLELAERRETDEEFLFGWIDNRVS